MRSPERSQTTTTEGLLRPFPHVITSLAELHDAVETLSRYDAFVIDVETTGLSHRSNAVTWVGLGSYGCIFLIPMGHPKGVMITPRRKVKTPAYEYYPEGDARRLTPLGKPSFRLVEHTVEATYAQPPAQLFPDQVFAAIEPLLFSDRGKVGHNVKFDLLSAAKYYGGRIPPGPYHDSIVAVHVCDESRVDYRLKPLARADYRIPAKRYPNLGSLGIENFGLDEAARYLAKDLHYCWLVFQRYHKRLVAKGWEPVYDFEMSLYEVIMDIEAAGFPIDPSALGHVRVELERAIAKIEERCWRIAGDEFSLSHTETKRYLLFGEGWKYSRNKRKLKSQHLRVLARTPADRKPAITQGILEFYADRNELAALFLEWSHLEKLRGTFVEGLSGFLHQSDGDLPTIHTSFKVHGTKTGRLSAEQPNLHQIPRGSTIRDLFVAGKGYLLIVADYDQIELRCAGYLAHDPEMIRVFRAGEDIHALAAATMLGIPVEEVDEGQRQVGKTQNFGTLYGASDLKIAMVARCSEREAAVFIRRYYKRFAGLLPWKERLLADARAYGDPANYASQPPAVVIPPFGRLRRIPDLYSPVPKLRAAAERQAVNSQVQGFASYIAKMAMVELHRRNLPAQMVVQVHDEIVFRVPEHEVDDVLPVVVDTMTSIQDHSGSGRPILGQVPLVVSAKVGYSWAEAKGK